MIGIFAPYDHSNVTTMATGLADLAVSLGYSASYYAFGPKRVPVHDNWDHKVKHDSEHAFNKWAAGCSHIAWFGHQPLLLRIAKANNCRNTLVVLDDYTNHSQPQTAGFYDCVIAPSVYKQKYLSAAWDSENIHAVPWDPGGPVLSKTTRVDPEHIWLYMPLSGGTLDAIGPSILYALNILFGLNKELCITIASSKRLSCAAKEALSEFSLRYPGRVRIIKLPKHNRRAAVYRSHDWTFYPAVHDDVYVPAIHSLYNGTPVVAFGLPPANECIVPGKSGYLIDCIMRVGAEADIHRLSAWPSPGEILNGLQESVCSPVTLDKLLSSVWPFLEMRRRTFTSVWKTVWDEPTRA